MSWEGGHLTATDSTTHAQGIDVIPTALEAQSNVLPMLYTLNTHTQQSSVNRSLLTFPFQCFHSMRIKAMWAFQRNINQPKVFIFPRIPRKEFIHFLWIYRSFSLISLHGWHGDVVPVFRFTQLVYKPDDLFSILHVNSSAPGDPVHVIYISIYIPTCSWVPVKSKEFQSPYKGCYNF